MADRDYSPLFWAQVAGTFKGNSNVMFDLFNEPYLERDSTQDGRDPWNAWRDGAVLHVHDKNEEPTAATYQAAGMQELVNAVRSTGAINPIMLGGLSYAQDLGGMLAHLPSDPAAQLVAAFHPYPGNPCDWGDFACLRAEIDSVAAMPVMVGEYGRDDCTTSSVEGLLDFFDSYRGRVGYLAWVWTVTHDELACGNGDWGLITDYYTGEPGPTGRAVRDHYLGP